MSGCDTCIWFWTEDVDDGSDRLHCADEAIDVMRVECPDWQEFADLEYVYDGEVMLHANSGYRR